VAMLPQNITAPALYETSVSEARIQAVSDGQSIAWRISWRDPSPDVLTDTDVFPDAVALEFPTKPGSNVMMGLGGGKVQILQWKALWQHDVDYGFQDVQDLHPNFWNGVYWFTDSEWPHPITEAFDSPEAQLYQVAYRAGNPMSDWNRVNPCEEMVAEGFGTLTSQSDTVSTARGIWSWDSWSVVFVRPLTTDDPDDYQFTADADQQIALAIWQGAEENVGGRKHWSNWSPFDLGE